MTKYTVKFTEFHGGHVISEHNSLKEALKAQKKNTSSECTCGCAYIQLNTEEAKKEYRQYNIEKFGCDVDEE